MKRNHLPEGYTLTGTLLMIGAGALLIAVIPPLRAITLWLVTKGLPHVAEVLKVVVHTVIASHLNWWRNIQPRQKLIFELDKDHTSQTQDN